MKKTILKEKADISFEEMVSSLELTEEEVSRSGKKSGGRTSESAFVAGSVGGKNKMRCYICNKPGHRIYGCH